MNRVEVVILTYKPDDKLKYLVRRLKAQTIPPVAIHIINTISGQESVILEEVKRYDTVEIINIQKNEFDHGMTRDMGINLCTEEYVLFMTQDAVPKNRYLIENLLKSFTTEDIAVAYAKQEADRKTNVIERYTREHNYTDIGYSAIEKAAVTNNSIKSIFCSDVCAMYKRELYDEIGGFPLKAIFNEDMVYAGKALKAEKDVIYQPRAVVIHSHNYTGMEYFKRYFDIGVSHKEFSYIFDEYHYNEDGMGLIIATAKYLCRRRMYYMLIPLIYNAACKFIGINLGKRYKKLPMKLIMKCTMNKDYFKK
jgi:rhamnosyltransferase